MSHDRLSPAFFEKIERENRTLSLLDDYIKIDLKITKVGKKQHSTTVPADR